MPCFRKLWNASILLFGGAGIGWVSGLAYVSASIPIIGSIFVLRPATGSPEP